MGNFPLPASSGAGVLNLGIAPPLPEPAQSTEDSRDLALLGVLREAATTGPLSTDAMLNALADAARVLSSADGTAIASRKDGVIVCRARSGDMAPDLDAPLNSDSGISGECLRTASIQICSDASTDERVDSAACRALGIRSVAVVPLRGRTGMFGILEAFSARTDAFENEHINALRSLAEIAEMAYEREKSAEAPAPTPAPVRIALFPVPARGERERSGGRSYTKIYWIVGCVVALLAMAWIARLSWRQTGAEIAASVSKSQPVNSSATAKLEPIAIAKPDAAIAPHTGDHQRKGVVEDAADLERIPEGSDGITSAGGSAISEVSARSEKSADDASESAPPPVQVAVSEARVDMPKFATESAPLPQFGGKVSQGIVAPAVVEQVNPKYPMQARIYGISGDVILDATITDSGSVRKVSVVRGNPSLIDAAVTAVRQWRFSPALLNGKPVEVQKRITIAFKLP